MLASSFSPGSCASRRLPVRRWLKGRALSKRVLSGYRLFIAEVAKMPLGLRPYLLL
jgi:hypothetical protein